MAAGPPATVSATACFIYVKIRPPNVGLRQMRCRFGDSDHYRRRRWGDRPTDAGGSGGRRATHDGFTLQRPNRVDPNSSRAKIGQTLSTNGSWSTKVNHGQQKSTVTSLVNGSLRQKLRMEKCL